MITHQRKIIITHQRKGFGERGLNLSVSGAVAQDVPEMAKQLVKMVIIIMIMVMIVMMILSTDIKVMVPIVSKVSEQEDDLVRVVI